MDKDRGNLIKVDRFGLVKRAMHGTRMLSWQARRAAPRVVAAGCCWWWWGLCVWGGGGWFFEGL